MVHEMSLSQKRELMEAIAQNDSRIVSLLENVPAGNLDFFMPDTQLSPFMLAIESNAMEAFEALFQAARAHHMGSRINAVNMYGMNALSTAVLNEQPDMIKKLIFLGASPLMPLIPGNKTIDKDLFSSSRVEGSAYTPSMIFPEADEYKPRIGLKMNETERTTSFQTTGEDSFLSADQSVIVSTAGAQKQQAAVSMPGLVFGSRMNSFSAVLNQESFLQAEETEEATFPAVRNTNKEDASKKGEETSLIFPQLREKESDVFHTPFSLALDMNFSKAILYMAPVMESKTIAKQVRRLAEMPGRLEIFQFLTGRCSQLDNFHSEKTPLIAACEAGEAEKVRLLIQGGASPAKDVNGYTPLMAAARNGNAEIVSYLVPYLTKEQINHAHRGITALGVAVWYKNETAAIYLMDRGADPTIRLPGNRTLLKSAVEFNLPRLGKVLLEQKKTLFQQENGIVPLWTAIRLKRNKFVRMLCDAGVDVNISNRQGVTPFALALSCRNEEAALELYFAGADINTPDEKGVTPLHRCIQKERKNAITWLVEKGAYLNTPDCQGQTPLMYAAQKGDMTLFLYLIRKGADKEVYDCYGKKAITYLYAAQKKQLPPPLIKEAVRQAKTRS